jgi:hypothetical protein
VPTAVILSESHLAHELGYVQDWLSENQITVHRIYRGELSAGVSFPAADLLISMGSLSSVVAGNNYVALGGHVTRQVGPWVRWHEDFITDAPDAIMIFHKGNAWGVQPHVELTPETLEHMAIAIGVCESDYSPLVASLALLDHIRSRQS